MTSAADGKMDRFTAIDFETANYEKTSACQLGLVVVEKGIIVKEYSTFIKPVPNYFIEQFIMIHGITGATVRGAPAFDVVWNEIGALILDSPFIAAHNAPFDMGVLKACLNHYHIDCVLPAPFCTCRAARKRLPFLPNHRLSTVCRHLDIPLNHHEALSDAVGAAKIVLKLEDLQ